MTLSSAHPLISGKTQSSAFIRALQGEQPDTIPVWFMRQAGRSLPEYREVREGIGMLDSCLRPPLAAEITLQPVRRHNVDAAIFFSDIVIPLRLAGVDVDIVPGVGPVLGTAVTSEADIERLEQLSLSDEALAPIREAISLIVAELAERGDGSTPLIGFAGAPFTLAAYMVEGKPSRDHLAARGMMVGQPELWQRLMTWCSQVTGEFLRAQILAGASASQLFDSWAGSLSLEAYQRHVAPASANVFAQIADLPVPKIHFGTGTGHLLQAMYGVGATAVGVDYRTPLNEANQILGGGVPLQGNIDPAYLTAPWDILEGHVRDVVERGRTAPGHVVNLGHGVPPTTDPTVLTRVVELIHSL
ncbi:uroporphyrinogen decarboxylase [Timonella sp. A28]|uniref:uroporphyrinogen decarboxylase n=1 Tax=Timonella sp. A28 TaxID=3442640 RepID=UPI003EC0E024